MLNISITNKKDKTKNRHRFLSRRKEVRARPQSTSSASSEDSDQSERRFYNRLSRIFGSNNEESSVDENYTSVRTYTSSESGIGRRYARKHLVHREETVPAHKIPPYSPTGAWNGKFPYSNFYVRLPNGKWMIRYRSGDRDILGTDEFEGYMI
ncbi:hypothetical protein BGW37DRAFT_510488 [Umbelopsis sp. PMI_123]|jgi:hypothetical protein|nr:hypothetical protein BGW37DRAFT_510488 [Umbelopsis sp. PMI_123]